MGYFNLRKVSCILRSNAAPPVRLTKLEFKQSLFKLSHGVSLV